MALLLDKKVFILFQYLDFVDIFFKKSANILLKYTKTNKHTIILDKGKKLQYKSIYILKLIKFENCKIYYIKTNLVNGFIRLLKVPASALIQFFQKSESSFYL